MGIKCLLPQSVIVSAGEQDIPQQIYRFVIPVGTAAISADSSDQTIYLMHTLDVPEAFLFKTAFAITPPIDRTSFLLMLESTGSVSSLLSYKRETISLNGDFSDLAEYQKDAIEISYMKVSQSLYYEVYGRN